MTLNYNHMVNFYDIKLCQTIIHKIGNKSLDEGMQLSENVFEREEDEELNSILLNYFISQFKDSVNYKFAHPSDIELNDIYNLVRELFQSRKDFVRISSDLANILYDCSSHPRIKSGELYVAYFSNVLYDDKTVDAVGIFKSENRQTFLKIDYGKNTFKINKQLGVNIQKLEKGALIYNVKGQEGFVVHILDSLNSSEAHYWKTDFLKLVPLSDGYNATREFLSVTKEFVANLPEDLSIEKTEQIDLMNRSLDYFNSNESFNKKDFENEVFKNKALISSFQEFDSAYRTEKPVVYDDEFDISPSAVKKQSKIFKRVLKLDRNFHIYIHGDTSMIERGEDHGRKFYKVYYNEER